MTASFNAGLYHLHQGHPKVQLAFCNEPSSKADVRSAPEVARVGDNWVD